jgi:enoyl-[acyl-carrier protein] reductase I
LLHFASIFFISCASVADMLNLPGMMHKQGEEFMKLLEGKKILVCGVANDMSMAWAVAKRAAEMGAEIAMPFGHERMEKRVRPLAESIGAKFVMPCNVQEDAQMDALFAAIAKEWGGLDCMLHAIAFSDKNELTGRYADTTRENFKNTMDVSVFSLVDLARRASALMKSGGSIVTLTYLGGERSIPNYNVMGVAKSALDSSVRYLAADLGRDAIRVNAISAGPIRTLASSGVGGFSSILDLNAKMTPLRRNMTLEDVSGAAAYLFSDLSGAVTGEVHHVDCGYSTIGMIPNDLKEALLKGLE